MRLALHHQYLRSRLEWGLVKLWLSRPGRLLALAVVIVLLVGAVSLGCAFHLATRFGMFGSLLGAQLLIVELVVFTVLEPWIAPTGFRFRALHAFKAHPAGAAAYLARLDAWVCAAGVPCRVDILAGMCPWLLAYGIERCLAPERLASQQALGLQVSTAPTTRLASRHRL